MASSSQSGAQCQRQFPRAGEPYHLTAFYQELEAADAFDISQIISSDNEVDVLYNDLLSADSLMDNSSWCFNSNSIASRAQCSGSLAGCSQLHCC
jgi:hypothetical protein